MNKKLLFTGLGFFIVGLIGRIYANSITYVDAEGMLHDSVWLPIGTLLLFVGMLLLLLTGLQYMVTRQQK